MDLLGGYGSDDSSSSTSVKHEEVSPTQTKKPTVTRKQEKTATKPSLAKASSRRLGKKVMSLHAVLPQNIRDRLTKTIDDSESDDDDEDYPPPSLAAPKARGGGVKHAGGDSGLSSLLSELQSTSTNNPDNTTILGEKSVGDASEDVSEQPQDQKFSFKRPPQPSQNPLPVPRRDSDHGFQSVPKPSDRNMSSAAPQYAFTAAHATAPGPSYSEHAARRVPAVMAEQQESSEQKRPATNKKRSRKEMERALRSGNLDVLDQHDDIATLEHNPSEAQQYYVPEQARHNTASSVKMSSAQKEELTSKHRSKHQINQLLANASKLEMHRARALQGPSGSGKSSSHRADARRKYGW